MPIVQVGLLLKETLSKTDLWSKLALEFCLIQRQALLLGYGQELMQPPRLQGTFFHQNEADFRNRWRDAMAQVL